MPHKPQRFPLSQDCESQAVRLATAAGRIESIARMKEKDANRYCPRCGHPVRPPAARWQSVPCGQCDHSFYSWELNRWPRLPVAVLPILWVWAVFPAQLLLAGLLWPIPGPESTATPFGSILTNVAIHGGPPILYAWSVYVLSYRGVRWFGLAAILHTAVLVILNLALAVGLLPVLLPLMG